MLSGLPQQLLDKLQSLWQSVQNAAARLVLTARRQGLNVGYNISVAVLTYRCLHGSAPEYLSRQLQRVSHVHTRQRLRSSSSTTLVISRTSQATIGTRAFSAAAISVCNSLPEAVRSSPSLMLYRKLLKTELFTRSYVG